MAGALYFVVMFALGFVLGTLRVLVVAPRLGDWGATLIELPIMLTLSWFACRWLVGRFAVPGRVAPRLAMGATAFMLLMVAEILLGTSLLGRTLTQQVQAMTGGVGLLGLLGQFAFAAFPLVQTSPQRRGERPWS